MVEGVHTALVLVVSVGCLVVCVIVVVLMCKMMCGGVGLMEAAEAQGLTDATEEWVWEA